MRFLRSHKVEICIFILALAVRFLFLGLSYTAHDGNLTQVINGGDGYYDISQNIIAGNGYSTAHEPPYTPTSFRTPVTSYFIALIYLLFGSYFVAIIVHIILGSIIPLLGMKLARFITDIRGISIAVGIFLALEPVGALLSIMFLSETLFTFLFLFSLLYLFRYWKNKTLAPLLISAFFLGASILTRPTVEYLPVVIIALIIWESRAQLSRTVFVRVVLYALVFLITLSPWLYRNYQTFGVLGLSSQQGAALYAIIVPSVLAIQNGTNFSQEVIPGVEGINTNFAQSAEYSKLAIPILIHHPKALALLYANTSFSFFTYDGIFEVLRYIRFNNFDVDGGMFSILSKAKTDSGISLGTPTLFLLMSEPMKVLKYLIALSTTPLAFILVGRAVWFLITIAFLLSAWHFMHKERQNVYVLAAIGIIVYFMLTTIAVGYTITTRYRTPVNALIITFAACECVFLASRFRTKFYVAKHVPMV